MHDVSALYTLKKRKFYNVAQVVAKPVLIKSPGAGLSGPNFGSIYGGAHSNSIWLGRIQIRGDLTRRFNGLKCTVSVARFLNAPSPNVI